jgi:hypothetical protein
VDWVDALGFVASAAVLGTFCMQRMLMIRVLALASNVLFAAYGHLRHVHPVAALHIILFPINAFRLLQIMILTRGFGYFAGEHHRSDDAADAGRAKCDLPSRFDDAAISASPQ